MLYFWKSANCFIQIKDTVLARPRAGLLCSQLVTWKAQRSEVSTPAHATWPLPFASTLTYILLTAVSPNVSLFPQLQKWSCCSLLSLMISIVNCTFINKYLLKCTLLSLIEALCFYICLNTFDLILSFISLFICLINLR